MKEKLYKVELSFKEIVVLDGNVSTDAQAIIDKAKLENSIGFDLPLMNEIIANSLETGILKWRTKRISNCPYCDKDYGYYPYTRSGRYHRKGDHNYDKPKSYVGFAFNEGFITIKGHGDICVECAEKFDIINKLCNHIIENDLHIEIKSKPYITKYLKDEIQICYECGKEMQTSKMGKLRALMGGTYPGECPFCFAKSVVFGNSHRSTNKFVMIKKENL